MAKTNGTIPLDEFSDNDEPAYEVIVGGVQDITARPGSRQTVTKGDVRAMFGKFLRSSPELMQHPREEQIREFNLSRREAKSPKVDAEILEDLLVTRD